MYIPNTNFKDSSGTDLGNILITKEYLMSVYPHIADQLITPELWIWGNNSYGILGTNDFTNRLTPVTTFAGGANWKQVSCGTNHTAAIKTDGTLWAWGRNNTGQLGTNDTITRSTPVTTFAGGNNWKQIDIGFTHAAAVKTDGTLWIWGRNNTGQLGTNGGIDRPTPVTTFAGGNNWKQVSTGYSMAAIKTDGTLWVWGRNNNGQLGVNDTTNRLTPVTTFAGGNNWKQIDISFTHAAAVKTDGTLWLWGDNSYGNLGTNNVTQKLTPVTTFAGGTNWKQVSNRGAELTSAIKTDGTLWVWGKNSNGQLGINIAGNRFTPVTTFAGGNNWKQVSNQSTNMSAIKTDGTLWVWGRATFGVLGIFFNSFDRSTPVTTFAGGNNWKQVSCSQTTMAAIKTSDDLQGI